MKSILLRCYPATPPERIEVLPWGCPARAPSDAESQRQAAALRAGYGLSPDARVLLCLSRISPEKGQDFLLETLLVENGKKLLPRRWSTLYENRKPAICWQRMVWLIMISIFSRWTSSAARSRCSSSA